MSGSGCAATSITSLGTAPMWGLRRARRYASALFLGLGITCAGYALHHPAKAWLGQHLLAGAFEAGNGQPWPWADFAALARIKVERLDVSTIALSSASGAAMAWGPGHVEGTAMPGQISLSAFAGHRDSHFAFLADLAPGDVVKIEVGAEVHRYRITEGRVIDSRNWRLPMGGAERLALSTCWPLGAETPGPLRLVLFADPV